MHGKWKEIVLALMLGLICPALLFSITGDSAGKESPAETVQTQLQLSTTAPSEFQISVLMDDGSVKCMELDAYLTAVVLREMPAAFETEALKAQAVVARTYALRRYATGGKHTGAAVCMDSSCCQGYCSQDEYLADGGTQEELEKVREAVCATSDLVLMYHGELIEATYFSCSGGMTEDAQAVWGSDIPYLQSVKSPGEEDASHYIDTVTFSADEFEQLLGTKLSENPGTWLERITYTDGGGVDTIRICGVDYKGTTLRQRLGLRSTAFVMSAVGNTITITTKGFGHRVGMSQYGADAMAVQGSSYMEILAYYYQGTELVRYPGN